MSKSAWSMKRIEDLFDVQLGKMLNKKAKQGDLLPYLANFNVRWGNFDLSMLNRMNFTEQEQQKYLLNSGDLLICEGGEIGRCAVWEGSDMPVFYQKALHRLRPLNSNVNAKFISYYIQQTAAKGDLHKLVGETSIAHFTREKLLGLYVPVPPIAEQTAITDMLSTWDKAIELKKCLIAEKKKQKKWLMQNLLTSKKRLQGFTDKWKVVQLADICEVIMGQSPDSSAYNFDGIGMPLIQGNTDCQDRISKPRMWTTQITRTCDIGDIIFTVRAPVGYIAVADQKACIGRGVSAIRPKGNRDFLFQYLISVEDKWTKISQGSTFDAISGDEIRKLKIIYPNLPEQTAIAQILSTADREIDLHEKHLLELKRMKKSLMQLLLTGIVRVNVQEVS